MGGLGENLLISSWGVEYARVFGKIVELIAENAVLSCFLFGGLIAMCWRHFRLAKRSVR